MRGKRFTEEQIIAVLKEAEAGAKTAELCRRHGVSEQTFYRWKARYGGLEVSELRRLRQLEDENSRLKRLVADLTLDNQALKELIRKRPDARSAAGGGAGAQGAVGAQRTSSLSASRPGAIHLSVPGAVRSCRRAPRSTPGVGGATATVRLSTIDHPAASGRLPCQS
jgi:putative transposase